MLSFLNNKSKKNNKSLKNRNNKSKRNNKSLKNRNNKSKRNNKSLKNRNNKSKKNNKSKNNKSKKNIKQDLEKMCLTSCEKNRKVPKMLPCLFKDPDNNKHRCFIDLENGSYQNVDSFYEYLEKTYGPKSFNKDGEIDFSYIMKN